MSDNQAAQVDNSLKLHLGTEQYIYDAFTDYFCPIAYAIKKSYN